MTRDEFKALPPALAIRVIVDALGSDFAQKLAAIEAPKAPRPPKYDMRISRKGGYQWASETDLDGLKWWLARFESTAAEGGKYADKDADRAKKLSYWVNWREAYPDSPWTGQRNDEVCTAPLPTSKPTVYEWEQRRDKPLGYGGGPSSDADDSAGGDDSFPGGW